MAGMRPAAQQLQHLDHQDSPQVFQKRRQYIDETVARYEGYGNAYPISSILLLGTGHDGWICSDDISRFIQRFNAESDGRVHLVDSRYQDFFEAASTEIDQKDFEIPTLEGSFGICWEEWAAHMAGLTADFREAQRLVRLAEAAEALRAAGIVHEDTSPRVRTQQRAELLDHALGQLLRFAEHDMGGMNRRLAAISAGVRADAATQALDIARSMSPPLAKNGAPSLPSTRPENFSFDWNGGRIRFDPKRCAVKSLVDANNREWVPKGSGPAFGEFVHTRYRTRAQKTSVFPEPVDRPNMITVHRVQCYRGTVGVHVFATFDHNKFHVTGNWLFHADQPWIDVTYRLQGGWTDDPQTVQIAFPIAMDKPVYRYDAPGAILVAAPKSQGGDDLPGANPRLCAGLTFASATSVDRRVVLLSPDTLLLEFGPEAIRAPGFEVTAIPAQITSMPMMNLTGNDWQFGQAGRRDWTYRYRVVLADDPGDPVAPLAAAQQFGTPPFLQVTGVDDCAAGLESLQIDFPGGPVLACKTAEDGQRLVLRLWNVRNEPCSGSVKLPPGFKRAESCDALERAYQQALRISDGRAHFDAGSREIVTIALCRDG
jgi:hypothetical protein